MQRQGSELTIAPLLFFAAFSAATASAFCRMAGKQRPACGLSGNTGRTAEKGCCRSSLQQPGIKTRQERPAAGNGLISEFQYSE